MRREIRDEYKLKGKWELRHSTSDKGAIFFKKNVMGNVFWNFQKNYIPEITLSRNQE